MKNEEQILDFLLEVYKLKEIKRSGWLKKVKVSESESVASHTFGMALIALLFGYEDLLSAIITHDIAESILGDLMPEEKDQKIKAKEEMIFNNLLKNMPINIRNKIEKTKNNRMVKEIDKLDMAIQALYYKLKGFDKDKLAEFIASADKSIKNKNLRKILTIVKKRFQIDN